MRNREQKPIGVEMKCIPELEFPRKLENCIVDIWCGAHHNDHVTTGEYEIWLLSPSSIKIDDGERVWEKHNVSILFTYPKQE